MQVTLLDFDAEKEINKMWVAARTCYSDKTPQELWEEAQETLLTKKIELLKKIIDSKHGSVIEHTYFTFLVSGVSRAMTVQYFRHRLQSLDQQSQRYCTTKKMFDYVTPDSIKNNMEAKLCFERTMNNLYDAYTFFTNLGILAEDARAVLPNAICTNFVATLNLRQLIHIAEERKCVQAQKEIREMVTEMCQLVIKKMNFLQPYLQPKCEGLGYCPESKKRSCGRRKTKEEINNA